MKIFPQVSLKPNPNIINGCHSCDIVTLIIPLATETVGVSSFLVIHKKDWKYTFFYI